MPLEVVRQSAQVLFQARGVGVGLHWSMRVDNHVVVGWHHASSLVFGWMAKVSRVM